MTEPDYLPDPVHDCHSVPGFDADAGWPIVSIPFVVEDKYEGGTGRFAGAKGKTVSVGCLYIDFTEYGTEALTFPAYVTFTATGTISY